jgi:hypothetical protein
MGDGALPIGRRRFLAAATGAVAGLYAARSISPQEGEIPLIYVSERRANALRESIEAESDATRPAAALLREQAEAALPKGPWSVTYDKSPAVSGDPRDYFSEGPYWWPDPENPDGPYIRCDGEVNPDRFTAHGAAMSALSRAVRDLSLAAFYLGEPRYTSRACQLLKVWFVDEATRMNPHLEYGQAIRGRTDGRGTGIIDTVCLIGLVHGVTHLARSEGCDDVVVSGVRGWFADYLTWLTTSKKGLDEMRGTNNHGTYWAAQVATYARLVGGEEVAGQMEERYRTMIVPNQIEPDGSCPKEEARTKSLSYSFYNADALALICEMAHHRGTDLWHFQTRDGRGIAAVVEYLAPYAADPGAWQKKQMAEVRAARKLFLQLAGARLGKPEYLEINEQLSGATSPLGPLALLAGGAETG